MPYSLILDVVFACLLVAALVYMARLNRRLDTLRSGRVELEALLKSFGTATAQAQQNVAAMRVAAEEAGTGLQSEIERARGLREDLAFLADRANALADQLEVAVSRARPAAASAAAAPAASTGGPSNIARMPDRAADSRTPEPAPARPLDNELLRRLATLR